MSTSLPDGSVHQPRPGLQTPGRADRPGTGFARWLRQIALTCLLSYGVLGAPLAAQTVDASTAPAAATQAVEGISLDVQDGDTFVLRDEAGRTLRIRVAGIDAPEKSQPWADRSRQHLRDLLRGQRLRVEPIKQDVFGRTVARVQVMRADASAQDAAQAQLDAGLAWHFKRYKSDQTREEFVRYAQAERQARAASAGLWQDPAAEAPWVFRARQRADSGGGRRP